MIDNLFSLKQKDSPRIYIEIALDSFRCSDWEARIFPVVLSQTTICPSFVIKNTTFLVGFSEVSKLESFRLFVELLVLGNNFTPNDMTGELESDTLSVRNKTDDELISSTAT